MLLDRIPVPDERTFSQFVALLDELPAMVANGLPAKALFLVPFSGILPGAPADGPQSDQHFDVEAPISESVTNLVTRFDVDSAHLVSEYVPAIGPVDFYTLHMTSFNVRGSLHFLFKVPGQTDRVELSSIPNFHFAQFGFTRRWHVSNQPYFVVFIHCILI